MLVIDMRDKHTCQFCLSFTVRFDRECLDDLGMMQETFLPELGLKVSDALKEISFAFACLERASSEEEFDRMVEQAAEGEEV